MLHLLVLALAVVTTSPGPRRHGSASQTSIVQVARVQKAGSKVAQAATGALDRHGIKYGCGGSLMCGIYVRREDVKRAERALRPVERQYPKDLVVAPHGAFKSQSRPGKTPHRLNDGTATKRPDNEPLLRAATLKVALRRAGTVRPASSGMPCVSDDRRLVAWSEPVSDGSTYAARVADYPIRRHTRIIARGPAEFALCWSADSRVVVAVSPASTWLAIRRRGRANGWTTKRLPVHWTSACVFGDPRCILGMRQEGVLVRGLDVYDTKSGAVTSVRNLPDALTSTPQVDLIRKPRDRVLLTAVGLSIDVRAKLHRDRMVGSDLMYDFVAGPVFGAWAVHCRQDYSSEGPNLIQTVHQTSLRLVSLDSNRTVAIAWPPRKRIFGLRAFADGELWVEAEVGRQRRIEVFRLLTVRR